MFEYFPGNYVWNLGVVAALNSGGLIDEVDRACRPIREAAAQGEDAGTPDFLRAWRALTDQLVDQAETAEKAGHELTAGQLYFRAANYLCQAERMLSNADPQRIPTYRRVLELAQKSFDLRDPRVSRVAVPYEGTTLPAYFSAAPATDDGPHRSSSSSTVWTRPRSTCTPRATGPSSRRGASPVSCSTSPAPARRCACRG